MPQSADFRGCNWTDAVGTKADKTYDDGDDVNDDDGDDGDLTHLVVLIEWNKIKEHLGFHDCYRLEMNERIIVYL